MSFLSIGFRFVVVAHTLFRNTVACAAVESGAGADVAAGSYVTCMMTTIDVNIQSPKSWFDSLQPSYNSSFIKCCERWSFFRNWPNQFDVCSDFRCTWVGHSPGSASSPCSVTQSPSIVVGAAVVIISWKWANIRFSFIMISNHCQQLVKIKCLRLA